MRTLLIQSVLVKGTTANLARPMHLIHSQVTVAGASGGSILQGAYVCVSKAGVYTAAAAALAALAPAVQAQQLLVLLLTAGFLPLLLLLLPPIAAFVVVICMLLGARGCSSCCAG